MEAQAQGFQGEASRLRSAAALERRCGVRAITTRSVVAVGTSVVQHGKWRLVDPQWGRGASSVKMGGHGVPSALLRGDERLTTASLRSDPDPDPAMASKQQAATRRPSRFVFAYQEAA